jgi:hypothetical protein
MPVGCGAHSVSGQLMGCLMKNGVTTTHDSLSREYLVVQINGRTDSIHRRYEDALRAGLLLKNQFPHINVKVCETKTIEEVVRGTVFH